MFMSNHFVGFGVGSSGLTESLFDRTAGTNIGNMTGGGNLAASFDGDTSEIVGGAHSSTTATTTAYVGKTHAAPKIISRAKAYGTSDAGFSNAGAISHTLNLYAKNGAAPANATDGDLLGTFTFTNTSNESAGRDLTNVNFPSTAYDHTWIHLTEAGGGSVFMVEVQLWILS